mgnify:CR=1 FL=1
MKRSKPIVERLHPYLRSRFISKITCSHPSGRPARVSASRFPINSVSRRIIEGRTSFELDGDILKVERFLPSRSGGHCDVVLLRSYAPSGHPSGPFVRALQIRTIEALAEMGRIRFPKDRTRAGAELPGDCSHDEGAAMIASVEGGRK